MDHLHLSKPYFTFRLIQSQTNAFINLVKERATVVPITTPIPNIATHPEDDTVLATAESGGASYVVTGDNGLLSLKQFRDIQVVNSRTFSAILQESTVI